MGKYHSLSTKLSVTTSIIATLMVVGIAIYALMLKHHEVVTTDRRDIDLSMSNTALTVNRALTRVEASMKSNVWHIVKCLDYNMTDSVSEVLVQLIAINDEITSCGLVLDIDAAQIRTKPYMIYANRDSLPSHKQLPSLANDPRNLAYRWLRQPLTTGEGAWSAPHADLADGRTEVCTYVIPVYHDKRKALFFADIPVVRISQILSEDMPQFMAESYLIDESGRLIALTVNPRLIKDVQSHTLSDTDRYRTINAMGDSIYTGKEGEFDFSIKGKAMPAYYNVINSSGWTLCYVVDTTQFHSSLLKSTQNLIIIFLLSLACLYLVLSYVIKRITDPLRKFSDSAIEISKGNFHAQLPDVHTNDEMALLHDSFDTMQQSLVKYMKQIEVSTSRQAFIMGELQIASRIQDDLLPKDFPPFPERHDIDVHAKLIPAKQIGGDLYNFFISDDKLFFIIGDVSGKSVPAAMVMAIACTVFNAVSSLTSDPVQIMHELNLTTCAHNEHSDFFITALVGVLDLKSGELQLCNAGHDPSVLIHPDGSLQVLKIKPNLPAGVIKDHQYDAVSMTLAQGSKLVLYTDGITEAENDDRQFYGLQRMLDCIGRGDCSLSHMIEDTVKDVQAFTGDREQSDDLTMMVISYTPSDISMPEMLTIKCKKEELLRVRDYCDTVSDAIGFGERERYKFCLVMEEAISNIINYSTAKPKDKTITINASVHTGKLMVTICDKGKRFDPTLVPDADTTAPLADRQVGGLGITLMRLNTAGMDYRRIKDKNYLTLYFDIIQSNKTYQS